MEKIGNVDTKWGSLAIKVARYGKGNALAVTLESDEGEPYGTFSLNIPELAKTLGSTEFFVKHYSENAPLVQPMLNTGLFEDTGRTGSNGFITAPVWKLATTVTRSPEH